MGARFVENDYYNVGNNIQNVCLLGEKIFWDLHGKEKHSTPWTIDSTLYTVQIVVVQGMEVWHIETETSNVRFWSPYTDRFTGK